MSLEQVIMNYWEHSGRDVRRTEVEEIAEGMDKEGNRGEEGQHQESCLHWCLCPKPPRPIGKTSFEHIYI
jgi:hypothetical protein